MTVEQAIGNIQEAIAQTIQQMPDKDERIYVLHSIEEWVKLEAQNGARIK